MFAFKFNPWEVPSGEVEQILSGGKALFLPLCVHALLCSCCCGNKGQHWALASFLIRYLLQISCIY